MTDAEERDYLDDVTASTYLALFTADPTDTGSVTNELSGNGYARIALSTKFPAASGTTGVLANDAVIESATATADWTAVTHMGIMESGTATTDDMRIWIALATPITVTNGNKFSIAIGDLSITAK